MEADVQNSDLHEPPCGTGPGGRLASAREAMGLTLPDVVRVLRLPIATLQALESNRFEDLPQPVFVCGYLRSYARLLGLDGEELVTEYERLVVTPGPTPAPATRTRRKVAVPAPYIRGAAALFVVTMVLLLGTWWFGRSKHEIADQSGTVSSEAEQLPASASALPPPRIDSPTTGAGPVAAPPRDNPSHALASESAEESIAAGDPGSPVDEAAAPAGPVLSRIEASNVTANSHAVEQRRLPEVAAVPAVPDLPIAPLASERVGLVKASRAPTGKDVLDITAHDGCWVEVVDANGYQLLYYLLRRGTERSLQGQAPLRVFLGNAPAVDLSLNHKRFDHKPFWHANSTARFTVDSRS